MQPHGTVLRMREQLVGDRVDLTPDTVDAEAVYEGPGEKAEHAWKAFCAVALEPAFDPIALDDDELEPVAHAGFHFAAAFTEGFAARFGEPEVPEHFELMFSRVFSVGEDGAAVALELIIRVVAADELRAVSDTVTGAGEWAPGRIEKDVQDWIARVEASPAFVSAMTRHEAMGFHFCVQEIG